MKTKDILTITTVALGTATLTVAAFWAGPIDAGSDADAPPAKIAKSRLVSHGVELTLASAGGRAFKAGDQPEFELTALNTTNQPASVSVCVTMTASSPTDALSRVIRLPSVLWQQEQVVTLQAQRDEGARPVRQHEPAAEQCDFRLAPRAGPESSALPAGHRGAEFLHRCAQGAAGGCGDAVIMFRWQTMVGVIIGLVAGGAILALTGGPGRGPLPSGPILSECDGHLRELVLHYEPSAKEIVAPVYRDFLGALDSDVGVHIVCPDRAAFDDFVATVGPVQCRVSPILVGHPITTWSRDRWVALSARRRRRRDDAVESARRGGGRNLARARRG